MAELLEPFKHKPWMKMKRIKSVASIFIFAAVSSAAKNSSAQLLSNMNFDEAVTAANDTPPPGQSFITRVMSTVVPFQKTASVNDGTGASATANYNVSDNGAVATISITESGTITANGNDIGEGTGDYDTTFQLLEPSYFTATMASGGSARGNLSVTDGLRGLLSVGAGPADPSNTVSGTAQSGLIDFDDSWGTGFNDSPQPANISGTYSLTLTFTAIPEPSSATLLTIPTAALLLRRRRVTLVGG